MSDKPKTFDDWWKAIPKPLPSSKKGYMRGARAGWSARDALAKEEIEATRQEMHEELKFYKSSEYFISVLFSKSVVFGDKSPIEYAIENKDTKYLKATLDRMLGGDSDYHGKLEEMQAGIDKRDARISVAVEALESIYRKETAIHITGGVSEKYCSYESGWEGVSRYAFLALRKLEELNQGSKDES